MEGLKVPFYSSTRVLGLAPFPLPLWCPVKGYAGDVAWLSSHHMPDPSPSPSHDDGAHAVLVAACSRLKIWSIHLHPFRKNACSCLSCWSTASEIRLMMSLARILLGTDRRVIPLQLLQLLRDPFFGIFTMTPSAQPSGSCFSSHIVAKSG